MCLGMLELSDYRTDRWLFRRRKMRVSVSVRVAEVLLTGRHGVVRETDGALKYLTSCFVFEAFLCWSPASFVHYWDRQL